MQVAAAAVHEAVTLYTLILTTFILDSGLGATEHSHRYVGRR